MPKPKLVLLPGLDGTGELFAEFVNTLPQSIQTEIIRYPKDKELSYSQLLDLLRDSLSTSDPFVLLAESFSTPLAIQYAAGNSSNLKGVILCAGFVTSPLSKWKALVVSMICPVLFRLPLPDHVARFFLVGKSDLALITNVRSVISLVKPSVLTDRLRSVFACDVRDELERIAIPLFYLRASKDRLVHSKCMEEIRTRKPHLQIQVIEGPHLLLQARASQTASVVANILNTLLI